VLNRRPQIGDVLRLGSGIRSRTTKLLSAVGLMTISSEVASAGRRSQRRSDAQGGGKDETQGNRGERTEKTQKEQKSDGKNDSNASAESEDSGGKSGKLGKQDRNQERTGNDESVEQNGSESGKSRSGSSSRSDDANSSSGETSGEDADSQHHGGRHAREFAQQTDESLDDSPPEIEPDATNVTRANPDVFIHDVPDFSINDLMVEANDDLLPAVSSSGGFAFARSGDVIAFTGPDGASFARSGDVIAVRGPDGASIVHTGDVSAGTRGTDPVEPPDDGGNNDPGFMS
jgi:hypothetical protein